MVVIGIHAHMRSHTAVAVDGATCRQIGELTVAADEAGQHQLRALAERFGAEREWAIEDCRALSRRLERALLHGGERVVRVPPKLMAGQRKAARTSGKSDAIDALAIARAAVREPGAGSGDTLPLLKRRPPATAPTADGGVTGLRTTRA